MVLGEVFYRFVKESPVSVIVCGMMERVLSPRVVDGIFARTARIQYERELLFSTVVEVMSHGVCGIRPALQDAYQASKEEMAVSVGALYAELNGVEPKVSQALVRHTAGEMTEVIRFLGGECSPPLEGYRVKILDGNALASTEHRLQETRGKHGGPAAGQSADGAGATAGTGHGCLLCGGWRCAGALPAGGGARHGGRRGSVGGGTQLTSSPEKPGRFNSLARPPLARRRALTCPGGSVA
jgi:hypothetical protein